MCKQTTNVRTDTITPELLMVQRHKSLNYVELQYSHVVKECMKEGLIGEAEEVLEWRDYLQE